MGIGFVLLLWAMIGMLLACAGAAVLGVATALLTRGVERGRSRAIVVASLFPFISLGWGGAVFAFQAVVNEGLLHRDPGLGDTWHCPLQNDYQLMFIDVTDQGIVYNPKTQPAADGVADQEDAVYGVRRLQVAGPYILGGADTHSFEHSGEESDRVDSYFVLDTRTGRRTTMPNYDALRTAALQLGVQTKLEPIYSIYSRYRFTWFDVFAGLLFCIPPAAGFSLLIWWILRLRKSRELAAQLV